MPGIKNNRDIVAGCNHVRSKRQVHKGGVAVENRDVQEDAWKETTTCVDRSAFAPRQQPWDSSVRSRKNDAEKKKA